MPAGIYPPVQLTALHATLYSVEIRTPSPVSEELARYAAEDDVPWETAANNALMFYRESFMTREDHARENVDWMIRNVGILPKRPRRLSAKESERRRQRTSQELSRLRDLNALGNLILPEEVYRFVVQQVESGLFGSPTEVLEAAIPSFLLHRDEPARADFI